MRSAETALKGKDTAPLAALYISFELSDKHWALTISDGLRRPSRYTVAAGDKAAVLDRICKPRRAAACLRKHRCTRATRPAVTAGGCTAGCANTACTTSWSTRPASRSTGVRGEPRPIGSMGTSRNEI